MKRQHAIDLLGLVEYEYKPDPKPTLVASSRGEVDSSPCDDRVMIEFCCSEKSKLGEEDRKQAKGCKVIRVTKDDATRSECIDGTVTITKKFMNEYPKSKDNLMIYISLPCTGGCPWNHINKESNSGKEKIKIHQSLFKKLYKGLEDLCSKLSCLNPILLFELPTRCEYWEWKRVRSFLKRYGMEKYKFDGCQVGTSDKHGDLIKKQWTLASNCSAYSAFAMLKCDSSHQHGESRGKGLKNAESDTYKMTDMIHKILRQHVHDHHVTKHTQYACPALDIKNPVSLNHPESIVMAVPQLVQDAPSKQLLDFWHEEIVNSAYHLVKSQIIQDQDTEHLVEGLLSQYTPQSVLAYWCQDEGREETMLAQLARLNDEGLSRLGTGDPPMSKTFWVIVSDSGLVAISGGRKNRMKYELAAEFEKKRPAHVEELVYKPLWGKTLRPMAYEVCSAIAAIHEKHGRQNTQIHVLVYWSGNELVGPTGVEDEPD